MSIYQKFKIHCQKADFFKPNDRILVAVSGGVDSTVLLHLMTHLAKDLDLTLAVVHINHQLRAESDNEAKFVRQLAEANDLPYFEETWQHSKISLKVEEKARHFRYSVFQCLMSDFDKIVTAHHADDQAETFLMRLIRGNRLFNLSSIEPRRPFANGELIRPLLIFTKSEIAAIKLPFVEDESNQSADFFRNRIRNNYLPLLAEENPQFSNNLCQLTQEISYAKDLIKFQMLKLESELSENGKVALLLFQQLSEAERYYFLLYYLEKHDIFNLSQGFIQQVLENLQNNKQLELDLNGRYSLIKTYDLFFVNEKTDYQFAEIVLLEKQQYRDDNLTISYNKATEGKIIPLASDAPITIRQRVAGDKIQLTERLTKKVRRLLIDDKIPINERKLALIVEQNGKIVAVLIKSKTYLSKTVETDTIKTNLYFEWKG